MCESRNRRRRAVRFPSLKDFSADHCNNNLQFPIITHTLINNTNHILILQYSNTYKIGDHLKKHEDPQAKMPFSSFLL